MLELCHINEEGLPMRNVHKYAQNLKKSVAALVAFVFFGFSAQANDILVVGQIAEPEALDPAAVTAVNLSLIHISEPTRPY